MTPYYEQDGITIYHGDCREVLPELPVVDVLITDPPYGVEYQSNFRKQKHRKIAGDEDAASVVALLSIAVGRLRVARHAYIFGPIDLSSLPLGGVMQLVWDKQIVGMGDLALPWGLSHELITFGVHFPSAKNRADGRGAGAARLRKGSVLRFQRMHSGQNRQHPTEKPVGLLRELVESSSFIGETVLDPFMGVGSTLMAAQREDRRAIGIEIDERYCEIAAKRLGQCALALEMPA